MPVKEDDGLTIVRHNLIPVISVRNSQTIEILSRIDALALVKRMKQFRDIKYRRPCHVSSGRPFKIGKLLELAVSTVKATVHKLVWSTVFYTTKKTDEWRTFAQKLEFRFGKMLIFDRSMHRECDQPAPEHPDVEAGPKKDSLEDVEWGTSKKRSQNRWFTRTVQTGSALSATVLDLFQGFDTEDNDRLGRKF